MAGPTENDKAWAKAFEAFSVVDTVQKNGFIDLTANELRQFREPRHMGKIDHKENLPQVFKDAELTILTLSNSSYRVGPFNIFQSLPKWQMPANDVTTLTFPPDLQTLDFENITGEPGVVNTAHATNMLSEFCGEDLLLTVGGRMRTGDFEFFVETSTGVTQDVAVSKAQMEIDAGYEGREKFFLFEVKNHASQNFNFRQLYYPYRAWSQRITKPVVPIFLTFSNDVFDLYEFTLDDPRNFSSGRLAKHHRYMLTHSDVNEVELVERAKHGRTDSNKLRISDNDVPFPQADSLERVIDLVTILIDKPQDVSDLATHFGFDPRQSDYYYNAAKLLGLATSIKDTETNAEMRQSTSKAIDIFRKPYREKYLAIAGEVLRIESIADVFILWAKRDMKPDLEEVIEIVKNSDDARHYSPSTIRRRSQTVRAWATWVYELIGKR